MAITFVAAGTEASGTSAPSPSYPAGLASGDIIIIHCSSSLLTSPSAAGAGFAALTETENTSSNQQLLWKRSDGSETGTLALTWSGSGFHFARMYAWRGCVAAGDPYEGFAAANGASTTTACPDVVVAGAGRIVVQFTSKDGAIETPSTPGDWTERGNVTSATSTDGTQHVFEKASGAGTVTGPDISYVSGNEWIAQALALIPEDTGGAAGQPTITRFGGIPGMRIGGPIFGRGW